MKQDLKDFFKNFDINDPKVKSILDKLYKDHGVQFETDVYKLYEDIINVTKPDIPKSYSKPTSSSHFAYPLTNISEIGRFVIIDVICPGTGKEQLDLSVETLEEKVFLRIKGIPWYPMEVREKKIERTDIEINGFDKRYDITHYDIDLNAITSEYKDGILTISMCRKPLEEKNKKNFTINIK